MRIGLLTDAHKPVVNGVAIRTVDILHVHHPFVTGAVVMRYGRRFDLGLAPDDFACIFTGRMAREKNLGLRLDAFARTSREHRRLRLLIAGGARKTSREYSIEVTTRRIEAKYRELVETRHS